MTILVVTVDPHVWINTDMVESVHIHQNATDEAKKEWNGVTVVKMASGALHVLPPQINAIDAASRYLRGGYPQESGGDEE